MAGPNLVADASAPGGYAVEAEIENYWNGANFGSRTLQIAMGGQYKVSDIDTIVIEYKVTALGPGVNVGFNFGWNWWFASGTAASYETEHDFARLLIDTPTAYETLTITSTDLETRALKDLNNNLVNLYIMSDGDNRGNYAIRVRIASITVTLKP